MKPLVDDSKGPVLIFIMRKEFKDKLFKLVNRTFFGLLLIMFLVCFATLPLVINSAINNIVNPPSEQIHPFTPKDQKLDPDYNNLHIQLVGMDEVNELAKLKIHGFRSCTTDCDAFEDRVLFFNADKRNDHLEEAVPTYQRVVMPGKSKEFTTEISVPMRGNMFFYPFDSYKLAMGVVVERKYLDGSKEILTPEQTKTQLYITMEEEMARVNLSEIKELDTKLVKPKKLSYEYAYAKQLKFERPVYLVIVVMLVIILSIVVTIFTMLTRPFDQLIINTSALIFGVWSIRSLLLTGYPSDITLLDTLLQGMVVFILMTLAFRGMNYFHRNGHMHLFPWAKAPLARDCPECLNEVSLHAKRCYACTAILPEFEEVP